MKIFVDTGEMNQSAHFGWQNKDEALYGFDFDIREAKKVGADFRNDLCNGMIQFKQTCHPSFKLLLHNVLLILGMKKAGLFQPAFFILLVLFFMPGNNRTHSTLYLHTSPFRGIRYKNTAVEVSCTFLLYSLQCHPHC